MKVLEKRPARTAAVRRATVIQAPCTRRLSASFTAPRTPVARPNTATVPGRRRASCAFSRGGCEERGAAGFVGATDSGAAGFSAADLRSAGLALPDEAG